MLSENGYVAVKQERVGLVDSMLIAQMQVVTLLVVRSANKREVLSVVWCGYPNGRTVIITSLAGGKLEFWNTANDRNW